MRSRLILYRNDMVFDVREQVMFTGGGVHRFRSKLMDNRLDQRIKTLRSLGSVGSCKTMLNKENRAKTSSATNRAVPSFSFFGRLTIWPRLGRFAPFIETKLHDLGSKFANSAFRSAWKLARCEWLLATEKISNLQHSNIARKATPIIRIFKINWEQ